MLRVSFASQVNPSVESHAYPSYWVFVPVQSFHPCPVKCVKGIVNFCLTQAVVWVRFVSHPVHWSHCRVRIARTFGVVLSMSVSYILPWVLIAFTSSKLSELLSRVNLCVCSRVGLCPHCLDPFRVIHHSSINCHNFEYYTIDVVEHESMF